LLFLTRGSGIARARRDFNRFFRRLSDLSPGAYRYGGAHRRAAPGDVVCGVALIMAGRRRRRRLPSG